MKDKTNSFTHFHFRHPPAPLPALLKVMLSMDLVKAHNIHCIMCHLQVQIEEQASQIERENTNHLFSGPLTDTINLKKTQTFICGIHSRIKIRVGRLHFRLFTLIKNATLSTMLPYIPFWAHTENNLSQVNITIKKAQVDTFSSETHNGKTKLFVSDFLVFHHCML